MDRRRLHLLVAVSAAALVGASATGSARAQTVVPPPEAAATEVETVVVTARKRVEALENVPVSADVVTGEALEERAVETGKDLSRLVPGVQVIDNGSGVNDELVIRGEGNTRQNNAESGSGLYRDGMFISGGNVGGRNFVNIDFFDVERVEVLRGPQGAFFGRNALGGVINVVSARPTQERGFDAEAFIGSQESAGVELVANLPVNEALAVRLGAFGNEQRDGFYSSSLNGRILDRNEAWGLRGSVAFNPTERFSALFLLEHGYEEAPRPEVFEQVLRVDDPPYNGATPSGFFIPRFEKPTSVDPRFTRDTTTARLDLSYDLGGVSLESITGFRRREVTSISDVDFQANQPVQRALDVVGPGEETFDRFVQDLRIVSADARFDWLAGVEYHKVDSEFAVDTLPTVPLALPSGCAGGVCTLAAAQTAARNAYRLVRSGVDDTSWAVYAAASYEISDTLELSADIRYTVDDKTFDSLETRRLDNPATPVNEQFQLRIDRQQSFEVFTPSVTLAWKPNAGTNVYGRVATGYRAGGFNNDPGEPGDDVSNVALPPEYTYEYVVSYEVGAKGRLPLLGRYELNLFHNIKDDTFINYAVFVGCVTARPNCAANTNRNVGALRNAGESTQTGLEAQLFGRVEEPLGMPGRFTYDFGFAFADGEYKEGFVYQNTAANPGGTLVQRSVEGNRPARLRELTSVINLGYRLPLSWGMDLVTNISNRGEFGGFEDAANQIEFADALIFDASIGLRGDDWSLLLIGKNVGDNSYYNISPLNQTFGTQENQPRTWRLRLTKSF